MWSKKNNKNNHNNDLQKHIKYFLLQFIITVLEHGNLVTAKANLFSIPFLGSISTGRNNSCDSKCFILVRYYTLCQPIALSLPSSSFVSGIGQTYRWEGPTQ